MNPQLTEQILGIIETDRRQIAQAVAMLVDDRRTIVRLKDDLLTARQAVHTAVAQIALLRRRLVEHQENQTSE